MRRNMEKIISYLELRENRNNLGILICKNNHEFIGFIDENENQCVMLGK